jgi:putative methyltransferase (TIGR04325 family)
MRIFRRFEKFLPMKTIKGYEHPDLVEVIFQKTVRYEPTRSWPEMDGVKSALDFGGACGAHYKEAKRHSAAVRWAVVETPAMVNRARSLETQQLRFFSSIDAAADWLGDIEIVHSSGALQYVDDQFATTRQLCGLGANRMLWFRLLMGDEEKAMQTSMLSDNGPGSLPTAAKIVAYQRTPIREGAFLKAHADYTLRERGPDWFRFSK